MSDSMPWMRQVWHVFAKDVLRHKWMLMLFVVHAFAGTMGGTQMLYAPVDSLSLLLLFFSLPITAAVLAAMVVLDDSPASATAWWPTLALSRQAVFAAKLLFVVGLIPLVLVVAMIALHLSLGVSIVNAIEYSLLGVRTSVLMLIVAIAVAALVKDLRAFVLAGVLLLVGLYFLLNLLMVESDAALEQLVRFTPNAYSLVLILVTGLLILATSHVYRKRSRSWYRTAAVLLLVPGLLMVQIKAAAATVRPDTNDTTDVLGQATLETELRRNVSGLQRGSELLTRVQLKGLAPDVQAALHLPGIRILGGESCRNAITLGEPFSVLHSPALPIPGDRVKWRGATPNVTYSANSLYSRTWGPYSNVSETCTLLPRAELHLRQPRVLGSVPLTIGATITRDGYRVVLLGANGRGAANQSRFSERGLVTTGELSSLPDYRGTLVSARTPLSYVLLHSGLREAVELEPTNNGSYARRGPVSQVVLNLAPRRAGSGDSMNFPESRAEMHQRLGFQTEGELDNWLRGAELLVFEWKLLAVIDLEPGTIGALHGRTDSMIGSIR